MSTIEEERDEWLKDHDNACVIHKMDRERHQVSVSTQHYGEDLQRESKGLGTSYSEALLVALRNWEAEWGWRET